MAECSNCGEVKPGAVTTAPTVELQGGVVGGQVVRPGGAPGAKFKCFDCAPWRIVGEPVQEAPTADRVRLRYPLARGDQTRDVVVELSGTVNASDPDRLSSPLDEIVATQGRSVLEERLAQVEPPQKIYVSSVAVVTTPREGFFYPGDAVVFLDGGVWHDGTFDAAGEPSEAVTDDGGVAHDVAWVRPASGGPTRSYVYADIRATRPSSAA